MPTYHHLADADVTSGDRDAIAALLSEVFEPHPRQREMVDEWAADPTRRVMLAREGTIVGVMVVRLIPSDDLDRYGAPFGVDLRARFGDGPVGTFQCLAVHPDHRGAGLGRGLAEALADQLRSAGAIGGVGISWDHGRGSGSRGMFEANGFTALAESRTFYASVNAASGQQCPHCKPEPCACNAVLFVAAPL